MDLQDRPGAFTISGYKPSSFFCALFRHFTTVVAESRASAQKVDGLGSRSMLDRQGFRMTVAGDISAPHVSLSIAGVFMRRGSFHHSHTAEIPASCKCPMISGYYCDR